MVSRQGKEAHSLEFSNCARTAIRKGSLAGVSCSRSIIIRFFKRRGLKEAEGRVSGTVSVGIASSRGTERPGR